MSDIAPKKLLILYIYNILKKYTDENHCLSQKNIVEILKREYDMQVDRKAVRRNLDDLENAGVDIRYTTVERTGKSGEIEEIKTDVYLLHDFSDCELRFMIDSMLFVKNTPHKQVENLVGRIKGLSSVHFRHTMPNTESQFSRKQENKSFFSTVDMLNEAIRDNKQISFRYNNYGTDKKLHPVQNTDSIVKTFIVNPYRTVITNGRYYLLGSEDNKNEIEYYQIDRITNAKILDSCQHRVPEIESGFDFVKHISEHIYMFSGESERVRFRANKYILSDIIDWFGNDITFTDETENEVTVSVKVNIKAMKYWAIQYMKYVTVLSPEPLVEEIKSYLFNAIERYNK